MSDIQETEPVELTTKEFMVLLRMTGGDVELQTEKTRALVRAIHDSISLGAGGRWRAEMTRANVEAAVYAIEVYCLNHQHEGMRLRGRLSREHAWLAQEFAKYADNPVTKEAFQRQAEFLTADSG